METFSPVTPLLLIFWLLVAPLLAGLTLSGLLPERRRTVFVAWLTGLLMQFVLFEPVAITCMIRVLYASFSRLVLIMTIIYLALCAGGIVRIVLVARHGARVRGKDLFFRLFSGHGEQELVDIMHPRRSLVRLDRRFSRSEILYLTVFALLLLLQLVQAVRLAPFDGDDAYYVVESVLSQQTDTIYTTLPYTGSSTAPDFRHALADYPIWIAFVARQSGIHATILAHTVLPLILIPACYGVFALSGMILFRRRRDLLPLFMSFLSLFMIFGNVSIYTPETFFLMRTWQGKSMVGNFVLPLMLWLLLILGEQEDKQAWRTLERRERVWPWVLLYLTNISAGFFSTSGIFIATMFLAMGIFFVLAGSGWQGREPAEEEGKFRVSPDVIRHKCAMLVLAGASCIPNAALVLMGLKLRPW